MDASAISAERLTLGYLTLDIDPLCTVEAAGKAGYKSVGIRITGRRVVDASTEVIGRRDTIRAIRQRLDDHGLRLSNISAYHFYPDVTLSHLEGVLDTAAELRADMVICNSYLADQSRFFEMFCAYCDMARLRSIRLAIEFMRYSQVKSLAAAAEIVRRSEKDNAGLLIDPLHLDRAGETPADILKLDPSRIFFAQLCDAALQPGLTEDELRQEARTARLYPGLGELPLSDFIAALPDGTEIEIETPRPELRGLDPAEQARRALEATRRFFRTP